MAVIVTKNGVATYCLPDDWEEQYSPQGYLLIPHDRTPTGCAKVADHLQGDPDIAIYSSVENVPHDWRGGWYTFNGSEFMPTDQWQPQEETQPAPAEEE